MKNISALLYILLLSSITAIGQLRLGEINTGPTASVIQTYNGGYALSGGGYWAVIELDSNGTLNWTKTIVAVTGQNFSNSLVQTKDKGYVALGSGSSFSGMSLTKLDVNGNLKWSKNIPVKAGSYTFGVYGSSMVHANDGGFLLGGSSDSAMYIVKTDSVGNIKWSCTHSGDIYSVIQTSDGGFAASGYSGLSNGISEGAIVAKLDSAGKSQWTDNINIFGVPGLVGASITQALDNGYFVTASCPYGLNGKIAYKMYVIKLDSLGHLKWNRHISRDQNDWGFSIIVTKDGGCVIAGEDYATDHPYAVRLDSAGNLIWDRTYLGQTGSTYSVIQTKDYGFALVGEIFIKVDSMGNSCQATGYGGSTITSDTLVVTKGNNMAYTSVGIASVNSATLDTSTGSITSICQIVSVEDINAQASSLAVFPNPGNGKFQLRINNYELGINSIVEIYNMLGEKVYSQANESEYIVIDIGNQLNGVYLYRVLAKDGSLVGSGKLVIQK